MKAKDGTYKWIETIGRSLLHDPAVRAVIINFRDVTERKALEEAKNEFFMIAAHQLRSPLTAIRWNLESALQDSATFPPLIKRKLKRVQDSSQLMIRTVNEILDVTRIIEGKLSSKPESVFLTKELTRQIDEWKSQVNLHNISIELDIEQNTETVLIDKKQLQVVLENILSNALKYTQKGSIHIATHQTKQAITVSITDTGIGIPKEEQSQLFTKFYRTTGARAIDAEGAGLGLFIVKSYIESWGGTVHIVSPITGSTGTMVEFTIPKHIP